MTSLSQSSVEASEVDNQLTVSSDCQLTDQQKEACEAIIKEIKQLTKQVIYDYWKMGQHINRVFVDLAESNGSLYGQQAVRYISMQTGHSVTDLYRMNSVYVSFTEEQIKELAADSVSLSNVIASTKIQNQHLRLECLKKSAEEHMTVREFKEYIDKAIEDYKASQPDGDESEQADEHTDEAKPRKGIRVRPGTGRKASSLTPLHRVAQYSERLCDEITKAVEVMHEARSGAIEHPKFDATALQAVGVAAELLSQLAGFVQSFEEQFPDLGDEEARESRRSFYQSVINALQSIVSRGADYEEVQTRPSSRKSAKRRSPQEDSSAADDSGSSEHDAPGAVHADHPGAVDSERQDNTSEDIHDQDVTHAESPQPRRRGRPRKNQQAGSHAQPQAQHSKGHGSGEDQEQQRREKEEKALNLLQEIRLRLIGKEIRKGM